MGEHLSRCYKNILEEIACPYLLLADFETFPQGFLSSRDNISSMRDTIIAPVYCQTASQLTTADPQINSARDKWTSDTTYCRVASYGIDIEECTIRSDQSAISSPKKSKLIQINRHHISFGLANYQCRCSFQKLHLCPSLGLELQTVCESTQYSSKCRFPAYDHILTPEDKFSVNKLTLKSA